MSSQPNNINNDTTNKMSQKRQGNEIEAGYRKGMSEYRNHVYFTLMSLIQIQRNGMIYNILTQTTKIKLCIHYFMEGNKYMEYYAQISKP